MKRRVVRIGDRRFQVRLPGGDISEFSYREKPRRWDSAQLQYLEFEEGEDRYILHWEGLFMDSFEKESEALLFILRFGYSISDKNLIPSEILADFNLAYDDNSWVDEWGCQGEKTATFCFGDLTRPENRKLLFEGYPQIVTEPEQVRVSSGWDNDRDRYFPAPIQEVLVIPVLDFAALEAPKKRRRVVSRDWEDVTNKEYETWSSWRKEVPDPKPFESGVFSLKTGAAASEAFQARKKAVSDLPE